ncbi:MAG: hypothetical protein ABSA58_26330 [Acetobacteraceae bacterium]
MADQTDQNSGSETKPLSEERNPPTSTTDDEPAPKRKYSKGLRGVQEFERHATRALQRVVQSVDEGLEEWRAATDRSARKRRDGAVRDALENSAGALEVQIRVLSEVPVDVARAVRSLRVRKIVRRLIP